MNDKLNKALDFNRILFDAFIKPDDIILDATCGNGNDTLVLAKHLGDKGLVYAFDIQEIAIENTRQLLKENKLIDKVELVLDSHVNIDKYIDKELDFVVYNLGYLPEGDKSLKTGSNSTIKGIKKALDFMKSGAILLVTCYRGHDGGLDEYNRVKDFTEKLDQKRFNSFEFHHINQRNYPPVTIGIEVRGGRL
ncbi:MAG: class I SAM-dependent methyltransferase [Gudongella sp.]|nr:class I SAM-dependent methyltransferase [Gudongella sp.]